MIFSFYDFNNIKILNTTNNNFVSLITESVVTKRSINIGYINTNVFMKCLNDEEFSLHINRFFLIPDGLGMYLASKFLYGKSGLKERIVTTDLWYNLLDKANENRNKIFFFGGSVEAAKVIESRISKSYPEIVITGVIDRDSYNNDEVLNELNKSNSDILFVGLGTPLQENWIQQNSDKVNIPVQIAVGSGIDYISGNYKRAPLALRKTGLEWLYRLIKEPKRLWKRYLIGIPVFVFKILCFKVRLLLNKS